MGPWSYSNLEKYESCPRQFYEVKVARSVVEPPTVHTEWGKSVHSAFEESVKSGVPLPPAMSQWQPLAYKLVRLPGEKLTEWKVALDKSYKPVGWNEAWTRGVIDLAVIGRTSAAVLDYKTGKRKFSEQLNLYASYILALYPNVETVHTAFVWLKDKRIDRGKVDREYLPVVRAAFLERASRLEAAYERNEWPERPSGLCNGWCPVKTCVFYRDKKNA